MHLLTLPRTGHLLWSRAAPAPAASSGLEADQAVGAGLAPAPIPAFATLVYGTPSLDGAGVLAVGT
jgi:hypothetical protein